MLPSGALSPAARIVHAGPVLVHSDASVWYVLNGESSLCLLFGLPSGLPAPPLTFSTDVGKKPDFRESQAVLLIKCCRMKCGIYTPHSPLALMSYFLCQDR